MFVWVLLFSFLTTYMFVSVCVCVCVSVSVSVYGHASAGDNGGQKRGHQPPLSLSCNWEGPRLRLCALNLGALQEQHVLLTMDPSPHPLCDVLFCILKTGFHSLLASTSR